MWKYKRAVFLGIFLGLIYAFALIFAQMMVGEENILDLSSMIYRMYPFEFLFFSVTFIALDKVNQPELEWYRDKTLDRHRRRRMKEEMFHMGILFLSASIIQLFCHILCSLYASVWPFIIRNILLYSWMVFWISILNYMSDKKRRLILGIGYLISLIEMFAVMHLPDSFLAVFNIFIGFYFLNSRLLLQYAFGMIVIWIIMDFIFGIHERWLKRCLD